MSTIYTIMSTIYTIMLTIYTIMSCYEKNNVILRFKKNPRKCSAFNNCELHIYLRC